MAIIAKREEVGGVSQAKWRVFVLICGIALLFAAISFAPQVHYNTEYQGVHETQSMTLTFDSSCSPFGSLLNCARFTVTSIR
ncbi:MAG TPA: hypothetical protein VK003_00830 [Oceanobacillus sp.]|nr:hypothetical protein [Oceanobacillus sp.]